jgi:GT2 family glycosyltransferase
MIEIDVVILSWAKNQSLKKTTEKCIETLLDSEDPDKIWFNIFLIESNDKIKYNFHEDDEVKVIYIKDKFGYHKYMNYGRRLGNAEYVVLCNNDLEFEYNWASNILDKIKEDDKILSACPFEPVVNNIKKHKTDELVGYETRKHLNGWCIFQKRKIYDIIGDLDETFEFWCCDDDYGMTLEKHGIKHMLVKDSVVHHRENGGKSLKELDRSVAYNYTNGGLLKFIKKYGHKPKYL